jgi:hypothetical protein
MTRVTGQLFVLGVFDGSSSTTKVLWSEWYDDYAFITEKNVEEGILTHSIFLTRMRESPSGLPIFGAEFETQTSEIGCKFLNFDHENSWRVMRSNLATDCLRNLIHEYIANLPLN